jgi:hypothetical protein
MYALLSPLEDSHHEATVQGDNRAGVGELRGNGTTRIEIEE